VKNLAGLMKQASQMQGKMQEMQAKLETVRVDGVSGAGMVAVTLSGQGELLSIKIDPKLADPQEMEMLQDLILAAHRDAKTKLAKLTEEEMHKVTGGVDLTKMKLPF
jgi:DNA-binding YbaB/EbfC family protein